MEKVSYLEIVKKAMQNNTTQIKTNKIKTNISSNHEHHIKFLIKKMFKFLRDNSEYGKIYRQIYKIIIKTKIENEQIINSMLKINQILESNHITKNIKNDKQWVADNIINILKSYDINNNSQIIDIGGGEGYMLSSIHTSFEIDKNNLYCVEQLDEWAEKYDFNKYDNFNYIFWDNKYINIPDNSVDVALIMVTLHHMTDDTLKNLMENLKRIMKNNGLIIIKEHDCINDNIVNIINWEHHLYHILMSSNDMISYDQLDKYLKNFINNYKSKKNYDKMFENNGFIIVDEYNRSFEKTIERERNNISRLYWKTYKFVN